jgi:hypothetical protein
MSANNINNNKELEIIIEEWEQIGKGSKTVPLVQIGTSNQDAAKERKIFTYVANQLKKLIK